MTLSLLFVRQPAVPDIVREAQAGKADQQPEADGHQPPGRQRNHERQDSHNCQAGQQGGSVKEHPKAKTREASMFQIVLLSRRQMNCSLFASSYCEKGVSSSRAEPSLTASKRSRRGFLSLPFPSSPPGARRPQPAGGPRMPLRVSRGSLFLSRFSLLFV